MKSRLVTVLAWISMLATPFVIYLAFGWKGIAAGVALIAAVLAYDFLRFVRARRWNNGGRASVLRNLSHFLHAGRETGSAVPPLDLEDVIPTSFSAGEKQSARTFMAAHEILLKRVDVAVAEFEKSLKVESGSGLTAMDAVNFLDRLESAVDRTKRVVSPDYAAKKEAEELFQKIAGQLRFDNDWRDGTVKEWFDRCLYLDSNGKSAFVGLVRSAGSERPGFTLRVDGTLLDEADSGADAVARIAGRVNALINKPEARSVSPLERSVN